MSSNLHIDLKEKNQPIKEWPRFFTFLGIAMCILGISIVLLNEVSLVHMISSSIFFIIGLMHIIQANPSVFKWARCYIDVSDSGIQYKIWGIQRKTIIHWESVKSITMDFYEITINLGEDRTKILNLAFVSDSNNRRIKQFMMDMGFEKEIEILNKNA